MKTVKNKGFTLIEIMIVIIVLAVISLFAINQIKNRENVSSINRSMVEIKYLLEASMAYFVDHDKWPPNLESLWNQASAQNNFINQEAQCSPWPGSNSKNSACPKKSIYTGKNNDSHYSISVETPNQRIAEQIAARLPQAEVSGNKVTSSVGIPGHYKAWITSAGIVDNSDKVYLPKCPEGYEGHYIQAPQYQSTGYWLYAGWPGDKNTDKRGSDVEVGHDNNLRYSSPIDRYYVYAVDRVHSPDATQYRRAYFMTMCLPEGQWKVQKNKKPSKGENQCDGDWQDYNAPFGANC